MRHPIVTIELSNGKQIVCELYPEEAPNTVNSFLYLARLGCFDGHTVERLVPGYVADMSFTAFGREEAKYLIPYEAQAHGFPNHLEVVPGTIAMGGYENGIAGGEFFFPLAEDPRLGFHYPAFGKVIEGMEEIRRWDSLEVRPVEVHLGPGVTVTAPVEPIVLKKVRVETFGEEYPPPARLEGAELPENWR